MSGNPFTPGFAANKLPAKVVFDSSKKGKLIFDGYPRTLDQSNFLNNSFLRKLKKLQLNMVFFDKYIIYKGYILKKIQYIKLSIMKAEI